MLSCPVARSITIGPRCPWGSKTLLRWGCGVGAATIGLAPLMEATLDDDVVVCPCVDDAHDVAAVDGCATRCCLRVSTKKGGGGGGTVPPITDDPHGNAPQWGRLVSGQKCDST